MVGSRGVGGRELGELLRRRWGEIHAEPLGSSGTVALDPDQPATLFRLALPSELQAAARRAQGQNDPSGDPVSFVLMFGPAGKLPRVTVSGEPIHE